MILAVRETGRECRSGEVEEEFRRLRDSPAGAVDEL